MSGIFLIALELSIPKIGFNIVFSLPVKKLDAFIFDGVAESDNTAACPASPARPNNLALLFVVVTSESLAEELLYPLI